ncbi:hypothetical protein KCP75_00155 [Salmonella enterica subsp. enterica]|nr:hypothetical protein KCP75_00155 [Salmonella enterica subsp. enterica]
MAESGDAHGDKTVGAGARMGLAKLPPKPKELITSFAPDPKRRASGGIAVARYREHGNSSTRCDLTEICIMLRLSSGIAAFM